MTGRREPRVFVGLVEVAGFYSRLAGGFASAGVDCTLCLLDDHPFSYGAAVRGPRTLPLLRGCMRRAAHARSKGHRARTLLWRGAGFLTRLLLFAEIAPRHDVFIFGFGLTFFRGMDLSVLRLMGRKIILVFNGSDHRPPYLNGVTCRTPQDASSPRLRDESARVKRLVTSLESKSDVVVAHHLSAQFHERPFVPSAVIGLPCDIPEAGRAEPRPAGPVRILHAPSTPVVKGTDRIRAAVARLVDRGYAITYDEISGRPNAEVMAALKNCDLVVDELFSDARMAGLASEAAMFGKPVIVAGYASDTLMRLPGLFEVEDFPPVLYCRPEEVEQAIETLVRSQAAREDLGARARRYVETQWRAEVVAKRFLDLVRKGGPAAPVVNPRDLWYIYGFGLDEKALAQVLGVYVETRGIEALHLNDKPELLTVLRQFCQRHASGSAQGSAA